MAIVETDGVLGGKPRLEGRRISVLQIAELVLDVGDDPALVADQLDISMNEVHEALAYYYGNIDKMDELRRRQTEFEADLRESSMAPDTIERSE